MTKTPTEEAVRLLIRSMIAESLLSSRPDGAETEDGTIEMACCVIDVATLAADVWGAVKPELSRLQAENSELRLAICGGEDAPGYADSLPLKTIRDVAAENLRSWRDASDRAARLQAERDRAVDKIDGLESDLSAAVEVAYRRGAHEWVRLNYPRDYERLSTLPPPVKEAEPEPVAWTNERHFSRLVIAPKERSAMWGLPNGTINIPLYTTPPPAQAELDRLRDRVAALEGALGGLIRHFEGGGDHDEGAFDETCADCIALAEARAALTGEKG